MNLKNTVFIMLIVLVACAAMGMASAEDSYSISQVDIDLVVSNSGLLHVEEAYIYNFDGTFNGVYRDIPLKSGESITNIEVYAEGAYPVLKESDEDGKKHLKIYLYADEGHTKKISDCSVKVYIVYDMKNVVNVFNDVGALQYKLLGYEWDVDIEKMVAHVELPNGTGNEFYLNPEDLTQSSSIKGGEIEITSNKISQGQIYELLVLMPVDDFADSPDAKHVNEDGREKILKNLHDSINSINFWNTITSILEILSLIFIPLSLIVTYLKYGREPKVDYDAIYERELPSDDPPAVVNALIDNNTFGEPNIKGFEATIMDLIDRKVFRIEKENNNLLLTFDKSADTMDKADQIVYDILMHFSSNGVLNLSRLKSRMGSKSNAKWFKEHFDKWSETVQEEYLSDDIKSRYFDDTGSTIASFIAVLGFALSILFFLIFKFTDFSRGYELFLLGIVVGVISICVLHIRDDIFGRWTEEGRVIYLKWKNFKEFLKDNSLINEHPPESIVIWKKYLIYGTSLGVAKNVEKAMNLQVPNVSSYDDGVFMYHYYGYYTFYYSFNTARKTISNSDGGSFGSFGGGSGGGGGGAF